MPRYRLSIRLEGTGDDHQQNIPLLSADHYVVVANTAYLGIEDFFQRLWIVMNGQLVHDCCAPFIHSDQIDVDTFAAKFENGTADGIDPRQVSNMRPADIDAHPLQCFREDESFHEVVRRREK